MEIHLDGVEENSCASWYFLCVGLVADTNDLLWEVQGVPCAIYNQPVGTYLNSFLSRIEDHEAKG